MDRNAEGCLRLLVTAVALFPDELRSSAPPPPNHSISQLVSQQDLPRPKVHNIRSDMLHDDVSKPHTLPHCLTRCHIVLHVATLSHTLPHCLDMSLGYSFGLRGLRRGGSGGLGNLCLGARFGDLAVGNLTGGVGRT